MRIRTKKYVVGALILLVFTSIALVGCGGEKIKVSNTDIYPALKAYENGTLTAFGPMREPYVIIHRDEEANFEGKVEDPDWKILGCSNGAISKKRISEARTIVICRSYFKTEKYSNGDTGDSEYVIIYCIQAKTGEQYSIKVDSDFGSSTEIARMDLKPLPQVAPEVPHFRYSDEEIVDYVNENFDMWRSNSYFY